MTLSPTTASLFLDQTQQFTVSAFSETDEELIGRAAEWSSDDVAVLEVDESGLARGMAAGTATVTVTVEGVSATADLEVRVNPVHSTSYENFKEGGIQPGDIPLAANPDWGFTDVVARGYGDFFDRDERGDMFTARITYSTQQSEASATGAAYTFWRRSGTTFVEDGSILATPSATCLHPRKALVADFNLDAQPDVFLICHGYDASPFPGERNQVVLSQADGTYAVSDASSDVDFWHGGAAADLDSDGYPDVIAVGFGGPVAFLNDHQGTFTREAAGRLPASMSTGPYFSLELADVDEDGHPDLLAGGHEWESAPTNVWLNPGDWIFSGVTPVTIDAVPDEGVIADWALSGTGPTRTIWVSRTSGGDGTFYESRVLQRFIWATGDSTVVVDDRPGQWVPWLIRYTRDAVTYVGSDDVRTPLEYAVP